MKSKIIKLINGLFLIVIGIIIFICSYYMIVDIQTQVPEDMKITCNIKKERFMGRNIFVITPKDNKTDQKKILYFHGGSYFAEATKQHWKFIQNIVNTTKSTVILPDYPLAPKYTYKDVFQMVIPLYKEVIEKVDANDLILMGDSAGGGITLALEEKISQDNIQIPNKTILISPWLDVRLTNPKIEEVEKKDKKLNKEALKLAGIAYASEDGMDSYLVNPIDGDLSKLKNITILIGTNDILNPDVYKLKEKAQNSGVEIDVKEYKEASHIWVIDEDSSQELVNQGYNDIINLINE